MDELIAAILLIAVTVTAIAVVFSTGLPAIEESKSSASVDQALLSLGFVDSAVREVSSEPPGSSRVYEIRSPGIFLAVPSEDAIEFEQPDVVVSQGELSPEGRRSASPFSRYFRGNIVVITGNDVSCSSAGDFILENTYLRAVFQNYSSGSAVQTDNFLKSVEYKPSSSTVSLVNSTIEIDDSPASRSGTGYSEVLRSGSAMPSCTVHYFVNSTSIHYDVYYTLYAGADFLVADVRSVVDK